MDEPREDADRSAEERREPVGFTINRIPPGSDEPNRLSLSTPDGHIEIVGNNEFVTRVFADVTGDPRGLIFDHIRRAVAGMSRDELQAVLDRAGFSVQLPTVEELAAMPLCCDRCGFEPMRGESRPGDECYNYGAHECGGFFVDARTVDGARLRALDGGERFLRFEGTATVGGDGTIEVLRLSGRATVPTADGEREAAEGDYLVKAGGSAVVVQAAYPYDRPSDALARSVEDEAAAQELRFAGARGADEAGIMAARIIAVGRLSMQGDPRDGSRVAVVGGGSEYARFQLLEADGAGHLRGETFTRPLSAFVPDMRPILIPDDDNSEFADALRELARSRGVPVGQAFSARPNPHGGESVLIIGNDDHSPEAEEARRDLERIRREATGTPSAEDFREARAALESGEPGDRKGGE